MPLCFRCSALTPEVLSNTYPRSADPENFEFYKHLDSLDELRQSAKTCDLCALILRALELNADCNHAKLTVKPSASSELYARPSSVFFLDPGQPLNLPNVDFDLSGHFNGRLSVYTTEDDPAARSRDVVGHEVPLDPESPATFATIRHWLSDCLSKHDNCRLRATDLTTEQVSEPPVDLPSRLIYVGDGTDSDPIRLVETGGQVGIYACLSHCWGKYQIITTTKASFRDRLETIPFEELSKTFQDAVTIVQRIGTTRYIWIDSLCIIQDDLEDWRRESLLMGGIYRKAQYTIAATGAEDGTVGCFIPRSPPELPPVTIPYTSPRYGNSPCKMTFTISTGSDYNLVDLAPLSRRGWTLQERILSRRTIHFTAEKVFFECQRRIICEDGQEDPHYFRVRQSLDLPQYDEPESTDSARNYGGEDWQIKWPIWWRWMKLVEEYSKRNLTKSMDKLIAVYGLAGELRRRTTDKYCAGMWMESLHFSLAWKAQFVGAFKRPETYRAPSWSWASVDGPTILSLSPFHSQRASSTAFEFYNDTDLGFEPSRAEVKMLVKHKTILYSERATSYTSSGEVKGRVLIDIHSKKAVGSGTLDFEPQNLPVQVECFLLYTVHSEWSGSVTYTHGVLLGEKVVGQQGMWRRLGAGELSTDIFGDVGEEQVSL
ncbi:heterokaryon incompatibility protein-domain-containing protein [Hypomontagnella submonticulosa]|nr:heterokaryon incompatibility protein-domain-containing protein [Hypomontagnella submonticulosa]